MCIAIVAISMVIGVYIDANLRYTIVCIVMRKVKDTVIRSVIRVMFI